MKMSNPTNLTDLAASLAASAEMARTRCEGYTAERNRRQAAFQSGYYNALMDTRTTVLAMISDIDRRIAANNRVVEPDHQDILDGRIEAYEDVRGGVYEGDEGQDHESYTDTQDHESYTVAECGPEYRYTVIVHAATNEEADRVIIERTGYDEDYGFTYTIEVDGAEALDPVEVER
jgi:hypothetical protein